MRIRTVLHPAVILAFADCAGFFQHVDRPATQGADRPVSSASKSSPALRRILEVRTRSGSLTHGWDSGLWELAVFHVFLMDWRCRQHSAKNAAWGSVGAQSGAPAPTTGESKLGEIAYWLSHAIAFSRDCKSAGGNHDPGRVDFGFTPASRCRLSAPPQDQLPLFGVGEQKT
jgi:hypothetical protein